MLSYRETHHLIIEYTVATETHGHLDFDHFIRLWQEAHAFARFAVTCGFAPEDDILEIFIPHER